MEPCLSRAGLPKKRWATKAAALFVADWERKVRGLDRHAYHCKHCGLWHVGDDERLPSRQRAAFQKRERERGVQ